MIRPRISSLFSSFHNIRSFSSIVSVPGETVLSFKDVSFEFRPNFPILEKVNFNIKEGSKVTIMGQNGAGKSTIMKLMNGLLPPKEGKINIKHGYALSRALQVVPLEDRDKSVREFFIACLHGLSSGADSRIVKALQTVELNGVDMNRPMKTFSGGQQARMLLASALILEPDIILLDEPTNNLDVQGIETLSSIIKNTPKTCVIISHDEDFLNSFTDSVLYLDSYLHRVEYYHGNYRHVKREITKKIEKENQINAKLLRDIQEKKQLASGFANKGGNAKKTAKKLKETVEEMEKELSKNKLVVRKEDRSLVPFQIPVQKSIVQHASNNAAPKSIVIHSICLPTTPKALDFSLSPISLARGNHVRIRGPNGVGKTTLLEAIVNNKAIGIELNPGIQIGYYRQDFHNLDHEKTVLECLLEASKQKHNEGHVRKVASQFNLRSELINQEVRCLSEGQKGLLSMACLVLQEPGLLILDEPTNHINFRHLPVIADALNEYEGTLLIVSHDQDFMEKLRIDLEIDLGNLDNGVVTTSEEAVQAAINRRAKVRP